MIERSSFSVGTIDKSVAIQQFEVCPSILIFIWAVNVKTDQLSQKLDMFFMGVSLVCTPKTVNICEILFTGPHLNIECLFI